MKKLTVSALIALASAGSGLYSFSPSVRLEVERQIGAVSDWSEEARLEYPVEFIEHVKVELEVDLTELEETRKALQVEATTLADEHKQQTAFLAQSHAMAEDFRAAYRQGEFPATIRDAAYTESDIRAQVRSLLAEADAYEANVSRIDAIREEAQKRAEELTVRIEQTHAELAALGAQRELLRTRKLTEDGAALLAQVDELMHGNEEVIEHINPVRSVRELAAASVEKSADPNNERVLQFLAESADDAQPVGRKARKGKKQRRETADRVTVFLN